MVAMREEAVAAFSPAHGEQVRWNVSRVRCAVYAVVCPALLLGLSAFVLASGIIGSGDAPTAAQREAEERAVAIIVYALFGVIGLLAGREFIALAVFGGGLAATPQGLAFTFGRRRMLFRWRDVAGTTVEDRSSGRGSYRTLAIRFTGVEYRWPRAFSLWFTESDCLCLSPSILEDRAEHVALGSRLRRLDGQGKRPPQGPWSTRERSGSGRSDSSGLAASWSPSGCCCSPPCAPVLRSRRPPPPTRGASCASR
jgi:hypothetical protein